MMAELNLNAKSYVDDFDARRTALPGAGSGWLDALREGAMRRFSETGFPAAKAEAWRWTDLRGLIETAFRQAEPYDGGIARDDLGTQLLNQDRYVAFIVNGYVRGDLGSLEGLPPGVRISSLAESVSDDTGIVAESLGQAAGDGDPHFAALNTALFTDGFVVHLTEGAVLDKPLHVVNAMAGPVANTAVHSRLLVVAEKGSRGTVVESFVGPQADAYFRNHVTELVAGEGAELGFYRFQGEGQDAFHIANTHVHLARGANIDAFVLSVGARLSRSEAHVLFTGEGAQCRLNGAYMGIGEQICDNTTLMDHVAPGCRSVQIFKGVLDERARGIFQGKVSVRPDAQHTDAHQLTKTLLLTPGAEADAKPELEIFADDVKCSHGATIGQIDADALFYLRTRGIPEREARAILIAGFLDDAIDEIGNDIVRNGFEDIVERWLEGRAGGSL